MFTYTNVHLNIQECGDPRPRRELPHEATTRAGTAENDHREDRLL